MVGDLSYTEVYAKDDFNATIAVSKIVAQLAIPLPFSSLIFHSDTFAVYETTSSISRATKRINRQLGRSEERRVGKECPV